MTKWSRKFLSFLLALSLLMGLALPALAAETASVIRLTKTTGTVEISKSSGKSISLLQNMRLYNGYHVTTSEESFAWINLDDSKLLKEDAESEVEVRKDGKKLEVLLSSGNIFFDVARPLEDDESLNIRTSTMAVGIRGTSGWVEVVDRWTTRVSVLEGTVECSVTDPVTGQLKAEKVHGGETALCVVYPQEKTGDKCDIIREKFAVKEIPGFVMEVLRGDAALCDKIKKATGMDVLRDPPEAKAPLEDDSDHDSGEAAETKPTPKPEAKPTPMPETKPDTGSESDTTPEGSSKGDWTIGGGKRPPSTSTTDTGSTETGSESASTLGSSNKSSDIAGSTGHARGQSKTGTTQT